MAYYLPPIINSVVTHDRITQPTPTLIPEIPELRLNKTKDPTPNKKYPHKIGNNLLTDTQIVK